MLSQNTPSSHFHSSKLSFVMENKLSVNNPFCPGPDSKVSDVDGQPYTTLLYGNGPGFATPRIVPMNTSSAMEDKNQVHGSAVPRQWGTHAGEDVPVYALGPLATTLFAGEKLF